ncbi:response regulator transcription factor [Flavobacterium sp. CBA20B-1]|uniref:response regulator transcription factor n=1 Tax=unclassified Flavobacterium TaxID=196869 RepID=UPI002225619B|nr:MULTISPECIES: response regulator transcription factor [unclassified Flavobacterium]WCM43350.1 response regulator transcription factor [Flavobacterium sp. CBA20B-1]
MSGKLHVYTIINNPIFLEGIENLIKTKIATNAIINHQDSLPLSNYTELKKNDKTTELLIYDVTKFSNKDFNQILQLMSLNAHFKVLIITSNINISDVKLLFEIGVMGIINNNVQPDQFVENLTKVINGKKVLSREYWDLIVDYFFHSVENLSLINEKKTSDNNNDVLLLAELTSREKEILGYICDGKSTREISEDLFLSLHTVETHRRKILHKMGVKNTASMVKMAIKCNLYAL